MPPLRRGLLTASCRGVLLLSSPKEVSKKGATVSTRWTPTRGNPWTPHNGKLSNAASTGFYPAHPAGRGYTPYRSGKRDLIGPTPAKKRYSFTAATKNVSPGLQGKAGSSREWDGLPSIDGGSPEGKTLWSSSTRSKGWRLSWFFFRRRKKNNPPASCRTSLCKKVSLPSSSPFRRCKTEERPRCRSGRCRHCASRRRLAIGSLGPASPLDPALRETIKCNFYWLLPGPPCGPGVQVLPQRQKVFDRVNGLQRDSVTLP